MHKYVGLNPLRMDPPYATFRIYYATLPAFGLSRYINPNRRPRDDAEAKAQEEWLERAREVVTCHVLLKTLPFSEDSLVSDLGQVEEFTQYLLGRVPGLQTPRTFQSVDHGYFGISLDALLPGFTMKRRAELVDILVGGPYQPNIPSQTYTAAEVMGREVNRLKELKKLWRRRLRFVRKAS